MDSIDRVRKLKEYWDQGQIPTLAVHEVHPEVKESSRENYLYFTLPPCINFQRNSPAMWQSALKTYKDPETKYVFFPEKVVKENYEKFKVDLARYNLSLLRNKHAEIWFKISQTLHDKYESDPRKLTTEGVNDAGAILDIIQVKKRELFPHLRGTKLSNYWLMILDKYTDVNLKNKHKISIIPDTHVIQASFKLGLCKENEKPEIVAQKWSDLLKKSGLSPVELHPVLWNWSRNGFKPEV